MKTLTCLFLFFLGLNSLIAQDTSQDAVLDEFSFEFKSTEEARTQIEDILELADEMRTTDPVYANAICDQIIIHAISHELYASLAEAYTVKSQIKYYSSEFDSSLVFTKKAIDWAELEGDTSLLLSLYNNQSNSLIELGRYFEAGEILTRTLSTAKRKDDLENVYKSLVHLVRLKGVTNDGEGMLKLIQEETDVWLRLDERGQSRMIYLRGLAYMSLRGFLEAKEDLLEVYRFYEQKADPFMFMNLCLNMSTVYMHLDIKDSALVYAKQALQVARKLNDTRTFGHVLRNMASLFLKAKQFDSAEVYIERAQEFAKQTDNAKTKLWTLEILIDVKSNLKKWKDALEATEAYYTVQDSLNQIARERSVDSLLLLHEVKEKEAELVKAKQREQIQRLKWQRTVFIFSLIVLLFIGLIALINYLNKRRVERLRAKQEEQRLKIKAAESELNGKLLELSEKENAISDLKERIAFLANQRTTEGDRLESADIFNILSRNIKQESDWGLFEQYFKQANPHVISELKKDYPQLTSHDLRLLALVRLNLSANEIAALFNISPESVRKAKYRLAKKLELNGEKELHPFVIAL